MKDRAPLPGDWPTLSASDRARPATIGLLARTVDAVLSVFSDLRVRERLLDAERRLAALEAQSLPRYEGVFESGKTYPVGSLTTKGGGLWLAVEPTARTPGSGLSGWRLIVKSGGA
jgi:hypothetical protein